MIRVQVLSSILAASVCFALLAPGLTSPSEPSWDPQESRSDLFDRHASPSASRAAYASMARTLSKWEGTSGFRAIGRSVSVPGQPVGAVLSLVSFSRISSTLTNCQVGPDNTQPAIYSVYSPANANGSQNCSTTIQFNSQYNCSANVPSNTNNPPGNTLCSISVNESPPAGVTYCTANILTTAPLGNAPQTCSTQGGISNPGNPTSGSVGCSAGGGNNSNANWCSANGSIDDGTCSTFVGNHQACSAGASLDQGNWEFCSVSQTAGNGTSTCSVNNPATGGAYGNKCSAIAMDNGQQTGGAECSVEILEGGSGGSCSVNQNNTGGTMNTMCTVYFGTGVTPTTRFVCSAFDEDGNSVAGNCSVLDNSGNVVKGPVNNVCGGPFKGHK